MASPSDGGYFVSSVAMTEGVYWPWAFASVPGGCSVFFGEFEIPLLNCSSKAADAAFSKSWALVRALCSGDFDMICSWSRFKSTQELGQGGSYSSTSSAKMLSCTIKRNLYISFDSVQAFPASSQISSVIPKRLLHLSKATEFLKDRLKERYVINCASVVSEPDET